MKNRKIVIITEQEFKEIVGSEAHFHDGFIDMPHTDWWGKLEEHLQVPVISVRQDRRIGWQEIFVIITDGYLKNNIRHLNGELDEIKEILQDIFMEAENDEYEVFDCFAFDNLSESEVEELRDWLYENY